MLMYLQNEWVKISKNRQLLALWVAIFLLPILFSYFIASNRPLTAQSSLELIKTKISLFFYLLQFTTLPISMLTFFLGLQLEYRNNTYYWPSVMAIDDKIWVLSKFVTLLVAYTLIWICSMKFSELIFFYFDDFKNINQDLIKKLFWESSIHFIFLSLPFFATVYLVGLLLHYFTIMLLIVFVLTYVSQLNYAISYPFNALRYSINLNELLVFGTSLWKYKDFSRYYFSAGIYSIFIGIIISYLISKVGIFKLFSR